MKSTDRIILLVLPAIALLGAFWLLILSPKRDEAATLADRVAELEATIAAAEQQVSAGETARDAFPQNYERLVSYGKAAPEDGDQSSLIYEIAEISAAKGVSLEGLTMTPGEAAPPPPPATPAASAEERIETAEAGGNAPAPAPPTEAAAAILPLGAAVGPAGLPTTPYTLRFTGSFFDMAGFFAAIDRQVRTVDGVPQVRGRLMTLDGFSLVRDDLGFPELEAEVATTTYIVPSEQGVTAGATPTGPAPAAPPAAAANLPASAEVAP